MIGHLWSFPSTLIGLFFGLGGTVLLDPRNRVLVITGGWMATIFSRFGFAGMCVGDVILCARPLSTGIYRHEVIHAIQGRILGPLYLPLTLLGYLYGFIIFPKNGHDASPLEVWADKASGNAPSNQYLQRASPRR